MSNINFDEYWNKKIWKIAEMKEFYEQCLNIIKPYLRNVKVLDAGCGNGFFTNMIRGDNVSLIGLDISGSALKEAMSNYKDIKFIRDDLCSVTLKEKFDLIVCLETLYYIDNVDKAVDKLCYLLNSNGKILCSLVISGKYRFNEVISALLKRFNVLVIEYNYKFYKFIVLMEAKK